MLSILGTDFSHAEHARKCLKVEYLGRIEYDFQKSRVTGLGTIRFRFLQKKSKKKFHACVPLITEWNNGTKWNNGPASTFFQMVTSDICLHILQKTNTLTYSYVPQNEKDKFKKKLSLDFGSTLSPFKSKYRQIFFLL
jgi:hypothetical protein